MMFYRETSQLRFSWTKSICKASLNSIKQLKLHFVLFPAIKMSKVMSKNIVPSVDYRTDSTEKLMTCFESCS